MDTTSVMTTQPWGNFSDFNESLARNSVYDRYTIDQLYALHRPAISQVNKFVTPVWYIVGFPGNLLAFLIWVQPRMRPSSGCYLAALAMADLVFLVLHIVFELQSTWEIRVLTFPVLCEGFPILFLASQYLSPPLVLGFTVERYISICHPFKRERYCSTSRAVKVITSLVVFSLALHAIQGYFWAYQPDKKDCNIRVEVSKEGAKSFWSIWSWVTELLFFAVVPLAILILNILVIRETKKMSQNEEKRLCLKRGHKSSATTLTLLAVSFYLIFTTLPVTVCYVLTFSFPLGNQFLSDAEMEVDPVWQRHFTYTSIKTIIQELGMSHYACNFYIYLITGKIFRRELKVLFYRMCCKKKLEQLRRRTYDENNSASTGAGHSVRSTLMKPNGATAHL